MGEEGGSVADPEYVVGSRGLGSDRIDRRKVQTVEDNLTLVGEAY